MVIDNTSLYQQIWDRVYSQLSFSPSAQYKGHSFAVPLPFSIKGPHSVYAIESLTDDRIDLLNTTMQEIFIRITAPGQRLYALDWQHSAFLYDPRDPSQQKSTRVKNARYPDGEYFAFFPSIYPDGDYYFFIEENFAFGCLGHPWRQELWLFGPDLLKGSDQPLQSLGLQKLK